MAAVPILPEPELPEEKQLGRQIDPNARTIDPIVRQTIDDANIPIPAHGPLILNAEQSLMVRKKGAIKAKAKIEGERADALLLTRPIEVTKHHPLRARALAKLGIAVDAHGNPANPLTDADKKKVGISINELEAERNIEHGEILKPFGHQPLDVVDSVFGKPFNPQKQIKNAVERGLTLTEAQQIAETQGFEGESRDLMRARTEAILQTAAARKNNKEAKYILAPEDEKMIETMATSSGVNRAQIKGLIESADTSGTNYKENLKNIIKNVESHISKIIKKRADDAIIAGPAAGGIAVPIPGPVQAHLALPIPTAPIEEYINPGTRVARRAATEAVQVNGGNNLIPFPGNIQFRAALNRKEKPFKENLEMEAFKKSIGPVPYDFDTRAHSKEYAMKLKRLGIKVHKQPKAVFDTRPEAYRLDAIHIHPDNIAHANYNDDDNTPAYLKKQIQRVLNKRKLLTPNKDVPAITTWDGVHVRAGIRTLKNLNRKKIIREQYERAPRAAFAVEQKEAAEIEKENVRRGRFGEVPLGPDGNIIVGPHLFAPPEIPIRTGPLIDDATEIQHITNELISRSLQSPGVPIDIPKEVYQRVARKDGFIQGYKNLSKQLRAALPHAEAAQLENKILNQRLEVRKKLLGRKAQDNTPAAGGVPNPAAIPALPAANLPNFALIPGVPARVELPGGGVGLIPQSVGGPGAAPNPAANAALGVDDIIRPRAGVHINEVFSEDAIKRRAIEASKPGRMAEVLQRYTGRVNPNLVIALEELQEAMDMVDPVKFPGMEKPPIQDIRLARTKIRSALSKLKTRAPVIRAGVNEDRILSPNEVLDVRGQMAAYDAAHPNDRKNPMVRATLISRAVRRRLGDLPGAEVDNRVIQDAETDTENILATLNKLGRIHTDKDQEPIISRAIQNLEKEYRAGRRGHDDVVETLLQNVLPSEKPLLQRDQQKGLIHSIQEILRREALPAPAVGAAPLAGAPVPIDGPMNLAAATTRMETIATQAGIDLGELNDLIQRPNVMDRETLENMAAIIASRVGHSEPTGPEYEQHLEKEPEGLWRVLNKPSQILQGIRSYGTGDHVEFHIKDQNDIIRVKEYARGKKVYRVNPKHGRLIPIELSEIHIGDVIVVENLKVHSKQKMNKPLVGAGFMKTAGRIFEAPLNVLDKVSQHTGKIVKNLKPVLDTITGLPAMGQTAPMNFPEGSPLSTYQSVLGGVASSAPPQQQGLLQSALQVASLASLVGAGFSKKLKLKGKLNSTTNQRHQVGREMFKSIALGLQKDGTLKDKKILLMVLHSMFPNMLLGQQAFMADPRVTKELMVASPHHKNIALSAFL